MPFYLNKAAYGCCQNACLSRAALTSGQWEVNLSIQHCLCWWWPCQRILQRGLDIKWRFSFYHSGFVFWRLKVLQQQYSGSNYSEMIQPLCKAITCHLSKIVFWPRYKCIISWREHKQNFIANSVHCVEKLRMKTPKNRSTFVGDKKSLFWETHFQGSYIFNHIPYRIELPKYFWYINHGHADPTSSISFNLSVSTPAPSWLCGMPAPAER